MKNKGVLILTGLVVALGLYAYLGEYKREAQETERKESDSRIITLKRDQIWKITLDKGGATKIVLEKSADGWNVKEPLQDQADNENAEAFLDQINGEKAVDKIGDGQSPIKWEEYGLQAPMGTMTFETNAGEKQTITVSLRKNFEGLVFLRREQENQVLTSSTVWSDFLAKSVDYFRNLKIFRSQISKVDGIQIQNEKGKINLVHKNGEWKSLLYPEWKMDQNAIREILTQVSLVKGIGIEDKNPSGKPKFSLEFQMGSEKWKAQVFAESAVANPPGLTLKVSPQTLEKIPHLELIQLRDKTVPFQFQRDLVQKITAKSPLKSFTLIKKDSKWELETPDAKFEVFSDKADDLIERLHRMEVYKYLPTPPKSVELPWQVQLFDEKGATVFQFNWGDFKQHETFAKTNMMTEIFQMDDAQINRMMLGEIVKPKPEISVKPVESGNTQEKK